jgi:probable HAF family extracellular repeat protein
MIAAALTALTGQQIDAQSPGTLIDLGTLGGTWTIPIGINDLGDVVGGATLPGNLVERPFRWSNGTIQPLDVLPGHAQGQARAINNAGQIVGHSYPAGGFGFFSSRAVIWDNGTAIDLNTAATAAAGWTRLAFAFDINDSGQIVGSGFRGNVQSAFLLDDGAITDLGTLGGTSIATSINRFGQIAGMASNADGTTHAVTWTDGVIRDLGVGAGGSGFSVAYGPNIFGETAGSWSSPSGPIPMFWEADGTPVTLPLLDPAGSAFDINNLRQIAGSGNLPGSGAQRAVVWEGGSPIDLETMVTTAVELTSANAINNAGQVVGQIASGRGFLIQLPSSPSGAGALIESLVDDAGVEASLLAKINGASGNLTAECNQLRAVQNEIAAQAGKKIPAPIAAALLENIEAAQAACQ